MSDKLTFTNFSEIELIALFEKSIRKVLTELPLASLQSENPENEFLREEEARKFIGGISKPTFIQLRKDGKIPTHYTSSNRIVFRKSELIEYLLSKKPSKEE